MKVVFIIISLSFLFLIVSCGVPSSDESDSVISGSVVISAKRKSHISLSITDAPAPIAISSVVIAFERIELNLSGFREDEQPWVTLVEGSGEIELLDLTNGKVEEMALTEVDSGAYNQMRIKISSARATIDGVERALQIPTDFIRLRNSLSIEENEVAELVVDFDASRSIDETEENYQLNPVLRVVEKSNTGSITGKVFSQSDMKFFVTSYKKGESNYYSGTISEETGDFTLAYLEPDVYDIEISAEGYQTKRLTDITVTAEGEINLTDSLGEISLESAN